MIAFLAKRLLWGLPVLFLVATITFGLLHLVPGGPFDREKKLPPEIKRNVEAKYHLDRPVVEQYVLYLASLARGDFGPSYKYLGRDVRDILADTFPVSMQLGLFSVLLALLVGVGLGIAAAGNPGGWPDRLSMLAATAGIATPSFILGTLLILVFAHLLHLFPPALWEGIRSMILPGVTLAAAPAAYIARLTRSAMLEAWSREYVRTARSKGLSEERIAFKHVLKNSLGPVVTFLGPLTAALVTGSFIVEYIFSIPGMGKFFITAVTNRDYPLMMAVTLVYSALIVAANIAVDLLYRWLDPRVSVE